MEVCGKTVVNALFVTTSQNMRNIYSVKLKVLEINRKVRALYYPRAVWWLENNRKRTGIAITAFTAMVH